MKKGSKMDALADAMVSRSKGSSLVGTSQEDGKEVLEQKDIPRGTMNRSAAGKIPETGIHPTAITGAFTEARPSAPGAETKEALLVGGGRSGSLGAASQGLLAGLAGSQANASAAASARQLGIAEISQPV